MRPWPIDLLMDITENNSFSSLAKDYEALMYPTLTFHFSKRKKALPTIHLF